MVRGGGFTGRKDDFSPTDLLTTQRVYVTIRNLSRILVLRLCLAEVFLSSWQICELAKIGVGAEVFMARVQAPKNKLFDNLVSDLFFFRQHKTVLTKALYCVFKQTLKGSYPHWRLVAVRLPVCWMWIMHKVN